MMERREEKGNKLLEICDELGLSVEEKEIALKFLSGEAGEGILSKIQFRDMTKTVSKTLQTVSLELMRKEKKEELKRWFLLLFAMGEASCYDLLDKTYIGYKNLADVDPSKRTVLCGMSISMFYYNFSSYAFTELISIADKDSRIIKKALDYKGLTDNGRLILLAAYFLQKYQIGRKEQAVKKEDSDLMRQYEAILSEGLCRFYNEHMEEDKKKELLNSIASGGVPEQFLSCKGKASGRLLRVIADTAYLNYTLSDKLENIVRICIAVNWREILESIRSISYRFPLDICNVGGDFDRVFGIDSADYIGWALVKRWDNILKVQVSDNLECYLGVMEKAGIDDANRMLAYIEPVNPTLYRKLVEEKRKDYKERVIAELTKKDIQADGDAARPYLRGDGELDRLYICFLGNNANNFYNGSYEYVVLSNFDRNFKDKKFFRRCEIYMTFRRASHFFRSLIAKKAESQNQVDPERVKKLFMDLNEEGLPIYYQVQTVSTIANGLYHGTENDFLAGVMEYFSKCLKENREDTVGAFSNVDAYARQVGLRLLNQNADEYKQEILRYAQDSSKAVKEELFGILSAKKAWEEDVKGLIASKKAAEREFAIRVLLTWQGDGTDYKELFAKTMEKEKNAKVRELLGNALGISDDSVHGGVMAENGNTVVSRGELVKSLHKGNRKRSLSWAYETPFSEVHMITDGSAQDGSGAAQGAVASEEYLQAILLCYTSADGCGVSKNAQFLAEALRADEFAKYVNELFDKWMAAGAESKKRWVLYAAAIHGGSDIVTKLERQIKEWPQESRGAIACEAVKALSLSPMPQALLIVDGIARKFKFKQVRAAAGTSLNFAASQLGITREELADRIVPDLGFDEKMERRFDYGERAFLVTITPELEIEVFEAKKAKGEEQESRNNGSSADSSRQNWVRGKKLKNLPAPGAKDDAAIAKAAYEEFKLLKKQMKATVTSQRARLEMALSTAREWSIPAWEQLFVKNPLMHQFAIGLIWGIYKKGKLVQSFRYMEDGSFNTKEEEEYELPAEGKIGLVHPVELTGEEKKVWEQQLEDYEIVQPFEQLKRSVYTVTKEEKGEKKLTRFNGREVNDLSLGSRLSGLGWYRGSVQDGGGFYTYYREDVELGLGVELHFSGSYVGGSNEDVTIYDVRFYKAGAIKRGSYVYDEVEEDEAFFIRDIPARYFSEVVWQITKATM
ncbi:MAG: DUF4132 domain-containing protein [Lachnospiraceae bacterium]|nr:DUF4132 domain-containing protein [Lachnospiraceae bacterium]